MSKKSKDEKNRWRNKTVGFRMSPEEAEMLDMMVSTSGMSKQDYIIKRVLQQEITVLPNPRMQKYLRIHLEKVLYELSRLNSISSSNEILDTIRYIVIIIDSMKEKSPHPVR